MNCRIIFYSARKTSFCEKSLIKSFSELNLNLAAVTFSTNKQSLGKQLDEAFTECNIVFVIGGLGFDDKRALPKIIASAVSETEIDDYKKLKNELGEDGYLLRADNQILVLIPDEPEQIEKIMQGPVSKYIKVNAVKTV